MTDHTKIEWTDRTWNPVTGCTKVSPGCDHCYAESIATRFAGGPAFPNGFDVQLREHKLTEPLRWRRPAKVFVNSMSDLFHNAVPDEYIARVWAVMALAPQHTFQVLTKRHGRMRSLISDHEFGNWMDHEIAELGGDVGAFGYDWPLPNVWLGVSTENQQWADIRIPALLDTPAAVRFISAEPLLGPIDLDQPRCESHGRDHAYLDDRHTERCSECVADGWLGELSFGHWLDPLNGGLDWVIVGGESGPKARPMHPYWARGLRDQCQRAGVPFHFKQWGEYALHPRGISTSADRYVFIDGSPSIELANVGGHIGVGAVMRRVGKKAAGRLLDGRTWDEYPEMAS